MLQGEKRTMFCWRKRNPVKKVEKKLSPFIRSLREHLETLRNFLKDFNGNGKHKGVPESRDLGKIGFVLSGGFFHGAFQIGALECVTEKFHIVPHYVVAASVGAINGGAVATGTVGPAVASWRNLKREEVYRLNLRRLIRKGVIGADAVMDHGPIIQLLQRHGGGEAILASLVQFDVVVTDFQKMEGAIFSNKTEADPRIMEQAILASTAVPVLFPPVYIRGRQYVDGGLVENTPLRHAIDAGCDTIFVFEVARTPLPYETGAPPAHGLFPIGNRAADIVTRIQLEYDLHRARQTNNDVQVLEQVLQLLSGSQGETIPQAVKDQLAALLTQFSFASKHPVRLVVITPDVPLKTMNPPIRGKLDLGLLNVMIDHGALVAEKVLRQEKIV